MIKLWRNLKNLSQKQLAFVKESCSTGLRWTSVGEAWRPPQPRQKSSSNMFASEQLQIHWPGEGNCL